MKSERQVRRVRSALVWVMVAGSLGWGTGAVAQESPELDFDLAVSPAVVEAGEEISVSGYCRPGGGHLSSRVSIRRVDQEGFQPYQLPSFEPPIDAEAAFDVDVTIPEEAQSGHYRVGLVCFAYDAVAGGFGRNEVFFEVTGGTELVPVTTTTWAAVPMPQKKRGPDPSGSAGNPGPAGGGRAASPAAAVRSTARFTG